MKYVYKLVIKLIIYLLLGLTSIVFSVSSFISMISSAMQVSIWHLSFVLS